MNVNWRTRGFRSTVGIARRRISAGRQAVITSPADLQEFGNCCGYPRVDRVMCRFVSDSESCVLAFVPPPAPESAEPELGSMPIETSLADVVTLQRRRQARLSAQDEESFFVDTLSEYQWARDAAGLAASTLDNLIKPVIEVCDYYGVVPWRLTAREVDRYFAGPGKRAHSTTRKKINSIDGFFAFLEQRYAGEIMRRFGAAVESPIDQFNRPRHRGDFGLRVPPSRMAMREFVLRWREELADARKYAVASRDYVMTKVAYVSGVRASELCGVCIGRRPLGAWPVGSLHGERQGRARFGSSAA